MGKLRRHRLEHEPGRNKPSEEEGHGVLAPRPPDRGRRDERQGRNRPRGDEGADQVGAGRRAMGLARARDLAEHVASKRLGEKGTMRVERDSNEPGRDDDERERDGPEVACRFEPARGTLLDRERERCEARDHDNDRAFDQHAHGNREPKHEGGDGGTFDFGVAHRVNASERSHGRDDRGREHGVRLG